MKKQLMMLALVLSGTVQAAMIPWHWWTDAAGSNVDAAEDTWNVYYSHGQPNPIAADYAWTAMSYAGGQWGGRKGGYTSSETLMADGYYDAPGVTIQVGAGGTYSWQGSAAATEYNTATLTFGKIAGGTWSSLYEMEIPVYTRYNLSAYSALQNISLNAGDTLTLYVRKVGGGYVDCDMSSATLLLVPEPTALALLGLGGLVLLRRRR